MPSDFGAVLPQWRSFDAKLAVAIRAVLHGDLLVRVNTQLDVAMLDGRFLSGRATLCAVIRNFKPIGRDFDSDALSDVYELLIANQSMEALQAYCSTLDSLLQRCREQPSPDHLCNKFRAQ
eukprot:2763395-Heterocapsa_arctica.AAC.1